jgi:hypothetical protein
MDDSLLRNFFFGVDKIPGVDKKGKEAVLLDVQSMSNDIKLSKASH